MSGVKRARVLVRTLVTSADRPPGRPTRWKKLSHLRHVGRVHAPESDMRPLLPHRDLLLKALANRSTDASRYDASPRQAPRRVRTGLALLCDESVRHVRRGDMPALCATFDRVMRDAPHPSTRDGVRWRRAVALNALTAASKAQLPCRMDGVMSSLTELSMLDDLPTEALGAVLDVVVRDKLSRGASLVALRFELMSRLLDTRLSAGAYTALLSHCSQLDVALSLLHRAVAVGVSPSVEMLNTVLAVCFESDDGPTARRVVAEMARRELRPNLHTIALLLSRADSVDAVDAVFSVARRDARLGPDAGTEFLRAYCRVGGQDDEEDGFITRCFAVVDWFFESGIGMRHEALDELVHFFAHGGQIEAALRAWREMRRGWLGSASMSSRQALLVALLGRGTERDARLWARLTQGLSSEELSDVNRAALQTLDDAQRDGKALQGKCVKDMAAVLHRWARTGRSEEVSDWLQRAVERSAGCGMDVRLLLALLSDRSERRWMSAKLLVSHLASGVSVAGEREQVLRCVTERVWQWASDMADDTDGLLMLDGKEGQLEELLEALWEEGFESVENGGVVVSMREVEDDAVSQGKADVRARLDAVLKCASE